MAVAKEVRKASVEIINDETRGVGCRHTFADGSVLEYFLSDLSAEMQKQVGIWGEKSKVQDAYAGIKDPTEAYEVALEVVELLKQDAWTAKREAAGEKQSSLVIKAFIKVCRTSPKLSARFADKSDADIIAVWKGYDDAKRKAIQTVAEFQIVHEQVKAERAAELAAMRDKKLAALSVRAAEEDIGSVV